MPEPPCKVVVTVARAPHDTGGSALRADRGIVHLSSTVHLLRNVLLLTLVSMLLIALAPLAPCALPSRIWSGQSESDVPQLAGQGSLVVPIRRPVAVIVDNLAPYARPQAGLATADIVFETLAEGGVTRFMAVYTAHDAPKVGPVRSTRLYFNSWAAGLGAILAHDGGNVNALQQLPTLRGIYDANSRFHSSLFWRTSDRFAPHNEYTSTVQLRRLSPHLRLEGIRYARVWPRTSEAHTAEHPTQSSIQIQFSNSDYAVEWRYDPAKNDYARLVGGASQRDAESGAEVRARNVVIMSVRASPDYDPFTPNAIKLATEGTGRVVVYRDGQLSVGMWRKTSVGARLELLRGNGTPLLLNPGRVWVEVVPYGNTAVVAAGASLFAPDSTSRYEDIGYPNG